MQSIVGPTRADSLWGLWCPQKSPKLISVVARIYKIETCLHIERDRTSIYKVVVAVGACQYMQDIEEAYMKGVLAVGAGGDEEERPRHEHGAPLTNFRPLARVRLSQWE